MRPQDQFHAREGPVSWLHAIMNVRRIVVGVERIEEGALCGSYLVCLEPSLEEGFELLRRPALHERRVGRHTRVGRGPRRAVDAARGEVLA